jgi:hypothetical protein
MDGVMHSYVVDLLESFQWMTSGVVTAIRFHPALGDDITVQFKKLKLLP